jgi:hypothetical protein
VDFSGAMGMVGVPAARWVVRAVAAAIAVLVLTALPVVPAQAAGAKISWAMQVGPSYPLPSRDNRNWITATESQIGRNLVLDPRYYIFGIDPIITDRERWARSVGKTPFIHLSMGGCFASGCHSKPMWSQVASGTFDGYLRQQAALLKAYGGRVYFGFGNEANHPSQKRGTPAVFDKAWNHIVSAFRGAGVTNVTYALTLTNGVYNSGTGTAWYPGNATVDVIAPTGYNWVCTPGFPNFRKRTCDQNWRSFAQVFGPANAFAVAHGKTLIAAETGTAEDPWVAGRKAKWIRDMGATAKSWPAMRGIIWFQAGKRLDYWRIDSSASSLAAFECVGNDPSFGGTRSACPAS